MLWISPVSVAINGDARRDAETVIELNTSVFPRILLPLGSDGVEAVSYVVNSDSPKVFTARIL
jgi:hypothetical protein